MTTKNVKPSKEDIVVLTLELAAARGWRGVRLEDIAQEAGISMAALRGMFEDKGDILDALGRMIDRQVLENLGEMEPMESPRDRLFDLLMERYDALNEYRPGVIAVLESFKCDPKNALISLPHVCRSMSLMMEAAGLHTPECAGGALDAIRLAGISGVYMKGLWRWKEDESPDLAKLMASLDKDLGRAEQLANLFAL